MKRFIALLFAVSLSAATAANGQNTSSDTENAAAADAASDSPSEWKICNETSFILRTAIAQREDDTAHITGWHRLLPSECMSETPKSGSPRFIFAESDAVHNGGIREWAGSVPICVNPLDDFDIDTNISCALQGLETRRFLRIDPNEPETKFIEPDDYGDKAETAGLQRLMQDAGYKISRVDGITGRRTRDTLREFLKDHNIDSNLPVFEKMQALRRAALSTRSAFGLTICNQTQEKSWISIGYREDGAWQSRGWWELEAQDCIRPWSKDLKGTEMHIYAQQGEWGETMGVLKNSIETVSEFCVSEGKFSALGREYCTDQGYASANFRPVVSDEKGLKINLTAADFISSSFEGLRE